MSVSPTGYRMCIYWNCQRLCQEQMSGKWLLSDFSIIKFKKYISYILYLSLKNIFQALFRANIDKKTVNKWINKLHKAHRLQMPLQPIRALTCLDCHPCWSASKKGTSNQRDWLVAVTPEAPLLCRIRVPLLHCIHVTLLLEKSR